MKTFKIKFKLDSVRKIIEGCNFFRREHNENYVTDTQIIQIRYFETLPNSTDAVSNGNINKITTFKTLFYRSVMFFLMVKILSITVGCTNSKKNPLPTLNQTPSFIVMLKDELMAKQFDEKYKEGITKAMGYLGTFENTTIYTYDINNVDNVIDHYCSNFESLNKDQCIERESQSSDYGIKKQVEKAKNKDSFETWLIPPINAQKNAIFFALSDQLGIKDPNQTPSYLAHLAIHEYTHVFQIWGKENYRDFNNIFLKFWMEAYAQFIGMYLGGLYGYVNFVEEMSEAFNRFQEEYAKNQTQFLLNIEEGFENSSQEQDDRFIYDGGPWVIALLLDNQIGQCASNCKEGLNLLKIFYRTANPNNHEDVFQELFNYSSYDEFYQEVDQMLGALSTQNARLKIQNLSNRLPSTAIELISN